MRITIKNGETRAIPKYRNSCKNSENLVDDWVPERRDSHASSSHVPFLEPTSKRSEGLGKHRNLTSRKTEIARSARGPKLQGPRAEGAMAELYFVKKILVIWLQQIKKFSVKVVNLETIIDMQSWYRTWPLNGFSRIRAKQKLLRKHKGACKSSWSRIGSLKSFTLTIPWNLEKLLKIFPGIIVGRHYTDRKLMGLLREQCAEWKKVHLQYCCNQVWMNNGGQSPWNAVLICETFERPVKNPSIWTEILTCIVPWTRSERGMNLEGWRTGCRPWGVGDEWRIGNLLKKTQCERGDVSKRKKDNLFFQSQMDESNLMEEIRNWEHTLWYGITQFEEKVKESFAWRIRRVSSTTSRLISGCRWSEKWLLVHVRKRHVPPSRWLQSQILLAERRFIPYSTEIHWRLQNYTIEFGCYARKPHRWLLEYRWVKRFSEFWSGFTQFTLLDEKSPDGCMRSGERLTKRQTSRPDHLWPELWAKLGRNAKLREMQKWSIEKLKLDNARRLREIYFIDPEDKEFTETIRKARKKLETPMARAMLCKTCKKSKTGETSSKTDDFKSIFACFLEASESNIMRMEESLPKYQEDHIAGRGDNSHTTLQCGTQIYSYASSNEDTRSKSSSG